MPEISPRPLAEFTSIRTGGAPARMLDALNSSELVEQLRDVWNAGNDWLVLGGGSNLFVGDAAFDGTVIRIRTKGIERLADAPDGKVRLRVQAGHSWDALVAYAVVNGYAGIEAMSGIPGTVGAAPVQNVGAYGQEIADTLVDVELLDAADGALSVVSASQLGLGFRTSILKRHYGSVPEREAVIVSVTLELDATEGVRVVRGEQLRRALALESEQSVTLSWIRDRIIALRESKGMVLDDADLDTHGTGSFFQNPVISAGAARGLPPECPRWPVTTDTQAAKIIPLAAYDGYLPPLRAVAPDVKVSAAWLIEHAGIPKGFALPGSRAAVSTKHALALTNRGGATAEEIAQLARFIQGRVHSDFGLLLQPEPILVDVEL